MDDFRLIAVRRPIVASVAGLVLGLFAAGAGVSVPGPASVVGAAACVWAFFVVRARSHLAGAALVGAFVFAGMLYWQARHAGPSGDPFSRDVAAQPEGVLYEVEGRIEAADIWIGGRDYMTAQVRVDRVSRGGKTDPVTGRLLLRWSAPGFALYVGDRVRVRGAPSLALAHVNPGTRGPEDHYRARGVHTLMRLNGPGAITLVSRAPWYDLRSGLSQFRVRLAEGLAKAVPATSLPLVLTVWLGDRRRIDSEVYQEFVESGTAHILAVSGLHVAIIFTSLRVMLRIAVQRRRLRLALSLLAVAAVAGMTGGYVSTVRATIMIAIYLAAEWFDREPDVPTALSIAAAIFLLHDPNMLYDVAFQLSFLSVASLLLFDRAIADVLERLPFALREGASATLAVQLLPLPVAVHAFHVLPLAAPLVNLVVIPLTGLVLWLGFLTSLCVVVLPPAAPLFGHALHPIVQAILGIVSFVGGVDGAHAQVTSPTAASLSAYALAMALAYVASRRLPGRRLGWAAGAGLAMLACIVLWSPIRPVPEVTVLDVGHGDSIFVRAPGGATMLVDAGQRSEFVDEGRRTVAPFLWSNHESKLDVLMLTHPDSDHIGGAAYIVEHFQVGAVVFGPQPFPGTLEDSLIELCEKRGVAVRRVGTGDRFALGGAEVEILHPPRVMPENASENDRSLVARVSWPGMSALLAGDIERAGEEALAVDSPRADVLKVPHHGSITSSSAAFIDAVHPAIAVISVAPRGRSTVLSPAVVQRYGDRGIRVFRTDVVGGVRLRPRDGGIGVEAARLERGYVTRE